MPSDDSQSQSSHIVKYEALPAQSSDIIEISRPVNFHCLLQVCFEKWRVILLVSTAAALVAAYFAARIPVKYQAKAVLQVDQEEQRLISIDAISREDLRGAEVLNTIVYNIRNSSVLRRVVRTNHLASNPRFLSGSTNAVSETKLVRALAGMVSAKLRPETRLIDIIVSHPDPELAEQLANSVAQEFVRQNLDERFTTARAANGLLFEESARLKAKLESSEKEIQAYKEATQTVSLEDRQNLVIEKLKDLTKRYTEAQSERLRLEADLQQVKNAGTNVTDILALPSVQADPAVAELRKRLVEGQIQVAALSVQYQRKYPKLELAEEQVQELERRLQSYAVKAADLMRAAYMAAHGREKSLEQALKQAQAEALELDKKSIRYNVLFRELQSDRALYDSVLKRLKETDVSTGLSRASLAIVEPASQPLPPIKPPSMLIIGGAWLLGVLCTVGCLYLWRVNDRFIRTVDQAEHSLGLPVWAAIPVTQKRRGAALPHVVSEQPASVCSESFRTLRTTAALDRQNKHENRMLLFTSADPAEGKTFCSVNYAICQAQEGKRTLLIDLDLRKPSLGQNFCLAADAPGVTDYLLHKRSLSDVIHSTVYPNLHVLPAGSRICNPAEELAKSSLEDLLAQAAKKFHRIVIDTPPLNAVSDTFLVLPFVDQVCLVVKSGGTSERAVKRAMELMLRAHVEPSGIVLNYLPQHSGHGYYYYYAAKYDYGSYGNGAVPKALLSR